MNDDLHIIFPLAAKFFFRKYKDEGGSQRQLADSLGISKPYLSSILNGSRGASVELQSKIANTLYGPYDKFLVVGRRLMEGKPPFDEAEKLPEDSVESLIAKLTHYIIDHKRLEKELENTRTLYQQIVENLPSGVFVTNADDAINFINRFMVEHAGAPKEKIIGVSMLETGKKFRDGKFKEIHKKYRLAKKSLRPVRFANVPVTTPAGRQVFQTGVMVPLVKGGQFDGMIITLEDTTTQHSLLNLLKLNMDDSDIAQGIVGQTAAGAPITAFYLNRKMRELVGQTGPEFDSYTVKDSLEAASRLMKNGKAFLEHVRQNFATGRDSTTFTVEFKTGENYEWTSTALYDEKGRYWGRSSKARKLGNAKAAKK